jgi:hypothetical protein
MSILDFDSFIMIQVKFFSAMSESFGSFLRGFLVSQQNGKQYDNSVMNSQSFLEDLIDLWEQNPPSTSNEAQIKCLKKAEFERNKCGICNANCYTF